MRVRVTQIDGRGVDLNVFKFPYFATWYAFFMNANGYIYARYGENWGKLEMSSLSGLKTVMKNVLEVHKKEKSRKPDPSLAKKPLYIESLPSAKRMVAKTGCLHCHHIWRAAKQDLPSLVAFSSNKPPRSSSLGIDFSTDRGNVVAGVRRGSRAERAGVRAGDVIVEMDGSMVFSEADVSWFLFARKKSGPVATVLVRGGKRMTLQL